MLVLTMFDGESVFAPMRAGARGYVLKDASLEDLARAITAVHRGEAIFSPRVAQRLLHFFGRNPAAPQPDLFPELTGREHEMLHLIVQGKTNVEIADHLCLTHKTVRNYVSTILAKLHVHDRAQAIIKAKQRGLA